MDSIKQELRGNTTNEIEKKNIQRFIVSKFSQNKARSGSADHKSIPHMKKKIDIELLTWRHVLITLFNWKY